jgi:hypothetical protein
MYLLVRAKIGSCLARLEHKQGREERAQRERFFHSQDWDEKPVNVLWRPKGHEQYFAIGNEQYTAHELQAHEIYVPELPGHEISSGETCTQELCGHESQLHEIYTPGSEVHVVRPQELPAESLPCETNSFQNQQSDRQTGYGAGGVAFESQIMALRTMVADRDRELAALHQAKDTADVRAEKMECEVEIVRGELDAHRTDLREAERRILKLKAKIKALEGANDVLHAALRVSNGTHLEAGQYSASRMEGPRSLLEEMVALDELYE